MPLELGSKMAENNLAFFIVLAIVGIVLIVWALS